MSNRASWSLTFVVAAAAALLALGPRSPARAGSGEVDALTIHREGTGWRAPGGARRDDEAAALEETIEGRAASGWRLQQVYRLTAGDTLLVFQR